MAMVATVDRSGQARTISSLRAHPCRQAATTWSLVAPGGTVMDRSMSWSWPRKTRWNQCSSTPVRCLMRPEQAGPGRHTGRALLLGGQPRGHPDHRVARPGEEVQQHLALGFRHLPACAVTHTQPPEIRAYPRGLPPANARHQEIGATVGQGAVTGDRRASRPEPPQPDAERHPPRHAPLIQAAISTARKTCTSSRHGVGCRTRTRARPATPGTIRGDYALKSGTTSCMSRLACVSRPAIKIFFLELVHLFAPVSE